MLSWLRSVNRKRPPAVVQEVPPAVAHPVAAEEPPFAVVSDVVGADLRPAETVPTAQPVPEPEPAVAVHGDEAALRALIEERLAAGDHGQAGLLLLQGVPAEHHAEDWYAKCGLSVATEAGDDDRKLHFAALLRRASPRLPAGYAVASGTLRSLRRADEAEVIIASGLEVAGYSPRLMEESARVAEARGDNDLAFQRWDLVRQRHPHLPLGFLGAIRLSQRLMQSPLAKQLIAESLVAFPDSHPVLLVAARTASQSKQLDKAMDHWRRLIDLRPEDPALQVEAALAVIVKGNPHPKHVQQALEMLTKVQAGFPDHVPAYTAYLRVLREARRVDEAEAAAALWTIRFPHDMELGRVWASLAEDRQDYGETARRLHVVRGGVALTGKFEAAYVRALSLAGRVDEAEAACLAALAGVPDDSALLGEYANLATRQGEWREALRRARRALELRPADRSIHGLVRRAQAHTVGLEGAEEDAAAQEPVRTDEAGAAAAEFFTRFESLGATAGGCEFGIVQRHFGAEPLGLLRWASIRPDGLVELLDNRFEGFGSEEHTALNVQRVSAQHQEYFIQDKSCGFWSHTFVKVEDTPYERMLKLSLRRMMFLRSKLLEDLQAAEKIFVYKFSVRPEDELLDRLFASLQTYAACTLLCVTRADSDHPAGTIETIRPGLLLGHATMFMESATGGETGIDTNQWRLFCEAAAAWHDKRVVATAPAAAAA